MHTEDKNAGKIELIPVEPVDTIEEVIKALNAAGYALNGSSHDKITT